MVWIRECVVGIKLENHLLARSVLDVDGRAVSNLRAISSADDNDGTSVELIGYSINDKLHSVANYRPADWIVADDCFWAEIKFEIQR